MQIHTDASRFEKSLNFLKRLSLQYEVVRGLKAEYQVYTALR